MGKYIKSQNLIMNKCTLLSISHLSHYLILIILLALIGCNKQNITTKDDKGVYKTQKYESPITLNMSYTINSLGNYYILAVLVSKETTFVSSFEINVSQEFIIKGVKKWSGEIKANIPKVIEIEISKNVPATEIIGVFTASILGNIFTTNQVLNLDKKNKPAQKTFIEKKNEKGEKIADFKTTK